MSAKIKLELDSAGIKELLNSDEISEECTGIAHEIAQKAGTGYVAEQPHHTGQRVAVNVHPETKEAAQDNYENNTLVRAIS